LQWPRPPSFPPSLLPLLLHIELDAYPPPRRQTDVLGKGKGGGHVPTGGDTGLESGGAAGGRRGRGEEEGVVEENLEKGSLPSRGSELEMERGREEGKKR